jgi:hypothetical protein
MRLILVKANNSKNKYNKWLHLYRCLCGSVIERLPSDVNTGRVSSCGCWRIELGIQRGKKNKTHGMSHSRTYKSWDSMKARCTNSNNQDWNLYGGRGIKVCFAWLTSFESFLKDMGERPLGQTLDRIDPNGDYGPGNCRWATAKEQRMNQRKKPH